MPRKARQTDPAASDSASQSEMPIVGRLGNWVTSSLKLKSATGRKRIPVAAPPGSSPGIESFGRIDEPPGPSEVRVQWHDYSADKVNFEESGDLEALCASSRPEGTSVRWINVDGLHPYVVNRLREKFEFHSLAAEDVLRTSQRPKLEAFEGHLFVVVRMLMLQGGELKQEQVSFFLFKDTLITFQEERGDIWDPIRQRLQKNGSRLRSKGPGYLLYALLDAVVDHTFPILEHYGDVLEELEDAVVDDPHPSIQQRIHLIKRELVMLRRVLWPLREVVNELHREETVGIPRDVKAFMRDVHDHAVQSMEIVETYREQASGLNDLYMSAVSNRMNEIMKVLTIMASFFIPITFVAGVYGMNFEHIPELSWKYSYAGFWIFCLSVVGGLLVYFWRRGWLIRK